MTVAHPGNETFLDTSLPATAVRWRRTKRQPGQDGPGTPAASSPLRRSYAAPKDDLPGWCEMSHWGAPEESD